MKPYTRPYFQSQGSREPLSQQSRIQCYQCGGPHKRNVCPQLAVFKRCNNCGKEGHFGKDSNSYPNSGPSPEPAEEGRQQASGIGQSIRHD